MFSSESKDNKALGWIEKYRPKTLKEVVGQNKIIKEIVKRLNSNTLRQNILFSGGSGTGKTTLGLILAKTINCENPKIEKIDGLTYDAPCNECKSCRAIANAEDNGGFSFFDGSDLNKDKLLELKRLCETPNIYGKGKRIIFVDEAQNIASGRDASIQTALKLVEKDYKDKVYFIFSTMNLKKINKALIDRFHIHFKLKEATPDALVEKTHFILEKEGLLEKINFKNLDVAKDPLSVFIREGMPYLTSASSGSVREYIKNLETCIYRELGTEEEIQRELELMSPSIASDILYFLVSKNDKEFFKAINNMKDELQEFFNISYNGLNDMYIYLTTGEIRLHWQKGKYDRFKPYMSNIEKLLSVYNSIFEKSSYFNKSYFSSKIITEYFNNQENITSISSSKEENLEAIEDYIEEKNVRRRRRR